VARTEKTEEKTDGRNDDDGPIHDVDRVWRAPVEQRLERLAADLPGGHVDESVAGELLGGANSLLHAVDEGERFGVGVLPVRRRPMGDDEDLLAGGRLAVPAVGQVEQPPSDDHRRQVAVLALHEVGRGLGGPAPLVGALEGASDVAVAVPVEQRPDVVVVVGDEPVQGDHAAHDCLGHDLVLSFAIVDYNRFDGRAYSGGAVPKPTAAVTVVVVASTSVGVSRANSLLR
jgi:hypothetical protein